MKKTIFITILLLISSTGTAHAGILEWTTTQIASSSDALQTQIADLRMQNLNLQAQINAIKNQPVAQVTDVTSQVANTNIKIDTIEKRVGTVETKVGVLETAMSFLQTNVIDALDTTIGLLKKLLKI